MTMWMKSPEGKPAKTLVRFQSPANIAGTALLTVSRPKGGQDNWLYVPALRQVRRVAAQDRSASFVQSDFTIEDLTVSMDTQRRVYKIVGNDLCAGRACTQVEDRPVDDAAGKLSGYGRVVLHVDDGNGLVHRVDFYDKSDSLLKVLKADGMEQVGDLWRFNVATVTNLQAGSKTEMKVTSRGTGKRIDDSIFAPGSLDAY